MVRKHGDGMWQSSKRARQSNPAASRSANLAQSCEVKDEEVKEEKDEAQDDVDEQEAPEARRVWIVDATILVWIEDVNLDLLIVNMIWLDA